MSSIEALIGQRLIERNLKLALAESCTGGLVCDRLTNVPGSSEYFLGGIVAYNNHAKEHLLGVRHQTLLEHGAVSQAVVIEMARGVRRVFAHAVDMEQIIGCSISGIAGPGGATAEKPVGLVWIGLSAPQSEQAYHFIWSGDRKHNKQQSAQKALELLLEFLQS